ncbi:hypothetical protein J3R30DRAFT_3732301 [Lentinula aciculospora]|uniref:Uncharacterized protein n=1 Tax=Lentinula aciculospora TaxID=153920 RepID=A0A9W9AGH1_9AGAR|nr:hypothetical protein J3R30DRAFT_3732301 [Lentinula aciculospora]
MTFEQIDLNNLTSYHDYFPLSLSFTLINNILTQSWNQCTRGDQRYRVSEGTNNFEQHYSKGTDNSYGRSRESIADLDEILANIFTSHPHAEQREDNTTVIPVRFLPDIFKALEERDLISLTASEEEYLQGVIMTIESAPSDTPHMVDSDTLLQLVAQLSGSRKVGSADGVKQSRGRPRASSTSSDSSSGSNATSRYPSRPPSRSSEIPQTPTIPQTPLDKRQRSVPLSSNPPSAYAKRPPPHRRKSDASPGRGYSSGGAGGDSDGASGPGRQPRSRAGSQSITSPSSSSTAFPLSPSGTFSPGGSSPSRDRFLVESGSSSPEDSTTRLPRTDYDFADSISRIPMPHSSDSDESDDDQDENMYTHLVFDPEHGPRSTTSSTSSLLPGERLEALSRANTDLAKRLQDAERTLSRKIGEHESELEELQYKLEDLKSELARSKRDEKELRAKERTNSAQISGLESEVARLSKELSNTRESLHALHKQYAEQTTISERYRVDLRAREDHIRSLLDQAGLHDIEIGKMTEREREWEDRVFKLEREVEEAREGCAELVRQKTENLGLKETIDRLRFEMDEMRSGMGGGLGTIGMPGSGLNSRNNTISKSLGAELQSQLEREERERAERGDFGDDDDTEGEETVVEEVVDDNDDEGNFVTTIIKRTRRKVASKAQTELPTPRRYSERRFEEFEDEKEFADCAIQYDPLAFFDPDSEDGFWRSASLQTEPEPTPASPVERLMAEMDIQTEVEEEEEEEDHSTVSSSTPTPTVPSDEPPAYPGPSTSSHVEKAREAEEQREKEEQAELVVLRKWHRSLEGRDVVDVKDILTHNSPGSGFSVPKDIMKDWARVQRAAGIDCGIMERLLATAAAEEDIEEEEKKEPTKSRLSLRRFSTRIPNLPVDISSYIPPTLIYSSLSVLVGVMLAPHIANQMNDPYGGATYYDRRAWSSFNNLGGGGEGFPGFGAGGYQGGAESALWKVLEAVFGGGARYARGLPT